MLTLFIIDVNAQHLCKATYKLVLNIILIVFTILKRLIYVNYEIYLHYKSGLL